MSGARGTVALIGAELARTAVFEEQCGSEESVGGAGSLSRCVLNGLHMLL
jgi:hypothetical protein